MKVLFALFFCVALASAVYPPFIGADKSWDFFIVATQWPGTWSDKIPAGIEDFTLHGVWPQRYDSTWPEFCDKSKKFNKTQVLDLWPTLKQVWPTFTDRHSQEWFLGHEWEKHGTCIVGLSQHDYFAKGIKLIQSMRLTEHFKEAGVIPSDSDSNPLTYYEDKLRSTFGFTPSFECEGFHRNGLFGMGLSTKPVAISDAYFCANKNWELFECPDSVREHVAARAGCSDGKVVYLPAMHHV
eukprot:TRINITY_DN494_c0_g1_i1.p1 TRINITY_DN494_c0_g1~~TRINITY_DN494_c0_g1_i1.p1  ORF type:complete len:240 (-),score=52.89 TRINITY_DN494_c0_g1_i1:152-871(-)